MWVQLPPSVSHPATSRSTVTNRSPIRTSSRSTATSCCSITADTTADPLADYLGPRCCGATLIGNLVAGVRVTPISGCLVGLGRTVGLTTAGASFTVDGSGGGGGGAGGGGGGCSFVAVARGVVVGGVLSEGAGSS